MKASRPISHDRHPAILILRVATIFASIVCVVAFAWMFRAHDEVYTDSVGSFLTLFPLIFVRLFLPRTDYGMLTKQQTDSIRPLLVPPHPPHPHLQ